MNFSIDELDYFFQNPFVSYNLLDYESRGVWINEHNKSRKIDGEYQTVCVHLRKTPEKFYEYFKIQVQTFDYILERTYNELRRESIFRECISPPEKLAFTLRYLATGNSLRSLSIAFRFGISSASLIVKDVSVAIWNNLQTLHMPLNMNRFIRVEQDFQRKYNFPNCIGCIDCFTFYPIVAQVLIDANYKFITIDVDEYENKVDGGSIFAISELKKQLDSKMFCPPTRKCLPGTTDSTPYVVLSSEGFQLKEYMLRPYTRRTTHSDEIAFNRRLSATRECVDNAFEILSNKWAWLLKTPEVKSVDRAINIIKCICLLHNIVIDLEEGNKGDIVKNTPAFRTFSKFRISKNRSCNSSSGNAQLVRNVFKDYFCSIKN